MGFFGYLKVFFSFKNNGIFIDSVEIRIIQKKLGSIFFLILRITEAANNSSFKGTKQ